MTDVVVVTPEADVALVASELPPGVVLVTADDVTSAVIIDSPPDTILVTPVVPAAVVIPQEVAPDVVIVAALPTVTVVTERELPTVVIIEAIRGPQGFQGAQGLAGPQGPVGVQGAQGEIGAQGPAGVAGPQGPIGVGVQGPQGVAGVQGGVGAQGPVGIGVQGAVGPQGVPGSQGPQGVDGAQGAASTVPGPQGVAGAQGDAGAQGPRGVPGVQGPQGDLGPQGPVGIGVQGPQGMVGVQGPAGVQGSTGNQGVAGVQGPPGVQGSQGAAGAQGDAGPQGPQGALGVGVQGVGGPQGVQGAVGPQGPAGVGVQGSPGPQGVPGAQGNPGIGAQGPQGYPGPQGNAGPQGVPGSQGPQGLPGRFRISTTAPPGAVHGDAWWKSDDGTSYIYYDDGTSAQWVQFLGAQGPQGSAGSGGGGGGSSLVLTDVNPPVGAQDGTLWWKSDEGNLKIYYDDGTSQQWVDASSGNKSGGVMSSGLELDRPAGLEGATYFAIDTFRQYYYSGGAWYVLNVGPDRCTFGPFSDANYFATAAGAGNGPISTPSFTVAIALHVTSLPGNNNRIFMSHSDQALGAGYWFGSGVTSANLFTVDMKGINGDARIELAAAPITLGPHILAVSVAPGQLHYSLDGAVATVLTPAGTFVPPTASQPFILGRWVAASIPADFTAVAWVRAWNSVRTDAELALLSANPGNYLPNKITTLPQYDWQARWFPNTPSGQAIGGTAAISAQALVLVGSLAKTQR